jgi:hypothetical protein
MMHDLLETIIAQATTLGDQGALRWVLKMINKAEPKRRPGLWKHFEHRVGRRIRHLVPELHRVFDMIETDNEAARLDVKSDAFDAKTYGLKKAAGPKANP